MSYEPSKRLFLGNLPPDCQKRDIIDFLRKRCRGTPSNIEVCYKPVEEPEGAKPGEDAPAAGDKKAKKAKVALYAHLTIEGLKDVIETINGIPLKGCPVRAEAAKPHYSVPIRAAIRRREQEERLEAEQKEAAQEELRQRLAETPQTLPIDKKKTRSFYFYKQKYAEIASEIAAKGRAGIPTVHGYSKNDEAVAELPAIGQKRARSAAETLAATTQPSSQLLRNNTKTQRGRRNVVEKENKVEVKEAPPPPPEPTKEERKLASLQAKLLALKQKLVKK